MQGSRHRTCMVIALKPHVTSTVMAYTSLIILPIWNDWMLFIIRWLNFFHFEVWLVSVVYCILQSWCIWFFGYFFFSYYVSFSYNFNNQNSFRELKEQYAGTDSSILLRNAPPLLEGILRVNPAVFTARQGQYILLFQIV